MNEAKQEKQLTLETLFDKNQLLPVLREAFQELSGNVPIVTEILVQIAVHRQCNPVTMVGILSPKYGDPQTVADLLQECVDNDFLDYNSDTDRLIVRFKISDDLQEMVDKYQYRLPMVVVPLRLLDNHMDGYLNSTQTAMLSNNPWWSKKNVCLDALNIRNSVALCIDEKVMNSPEGTYIEPERKIGEDFKLFQRRKKQAETFYTKTKEIMEALMAQADDLYLTHRYDGRGRCYASGYHVSTQGDDARKAMLQLANKEVLR